jgi:pyruvate/2-oxoglutarate dehydrogenase complex dihydrolipoamide acyltransferase (E2) component
LALLCMIAAMFIPVPQSVLAPAELISLQSHVVSSPVDGVVKEMLVRPNQEVTLNQALFSLDDTSLRNRREVLGKTLGSAQAELLATTQKAFDSAQSRGDIAPLKGRVDERRAELAFVDEQLKRSVIYATKPGIVVFGDPNDWRGRPITAGERVLLIADPSDLGVLIHVPVADAIAIAPGAKLRLFLSVAPLKPVDAEVIETGYQALLSPENVASYRLRARLVSSTEMQAELQRIGLKGTAKLLGPKVPLGYLLLRRPLAALREWTGL